MSNNFRTVISIPIFGSTKGETFFAELLYDATVFADLSKRCRLGILRYRNNLYSPNSLATELLNERSIDAWLWFKEVRTGTPIDIYCPPALQVRHRWYTV